MRALLAPAAFAAMCRGLRVISRLGAPTFLKMLARPQWLFATHVAIPHRPVTFTAPGDSEQDDLELCQRIIDAYGRAHEGYGDLSAIWTGKIGRYSSGLDAALLGRDPEVVGEQLRWLFRRSFLCGISTPIDYEDRAVPRTWSLMTYDSLVSLAEAVGAIRAENPEQGLAGRAFVEGIDRLPGRIEERIGVSLDFPRVGAPYGILIGDRLIIRETGRHVHAAIRLHEVVRTHLPGPPPEPGVRIVEIGGGFGGVAMWYLRLLADRPGSYTIVDLPLMNAFQAYFLGRIYGPDAIELFGEEHSAGARVRVVPPQWLQGGDARADIVFNQDSMPEMTETAARSYLAWMDENVTGLFVSCNQEVGDQDGLPTQLVVSEMAGDYERIERFARQPSWTRRGYVEEVYGVGIRTA
ncbi:MAG TPA: putative sugar O-methyltransferase [Baekduia sp.]|uniref:putative sugar O-methyltransferase n=1 Tax=Baekduia sp. TaxID=2600305 RepID=UPI002B732860|nr:putative sugar O-methyltransferase [Baekduia sp.]HMJ35007.1 putative sugar O-methyltransferase [Baekduia sp.]